MYNYEELKEFVDHCHRCSLCQTRNHSVIQENYPSGLPDYREHGTFLERKNTWLTVVYHPSAVLRDSSKLPQMQEDFRKIKNLQDQLRSDFVSP